MDGIARIWQSYKLPLILGSVSLFLIIVSLITLVKSTQVADPILFSSSVINQASASANIDNIFVDVEGAVVKPGLYQLSKSSRVEDAIAKAGGLSSEANLTQIAKTINRAARLSDGAKLYFPKTGDTSLSQSSSGLNSPGNTGDEFFLVNINSASQTQLEALPGIGPSTAQKIINNRPYQTLEELVSKKALGQSLFSKLKDQLTL